MTGSPTICESCHCYLTGKIDTYGNHEQHLCFTCWHEIMDEWERDATIVRELMWSDSYAQEKSAEEQSEPKTPRKHKAFTAI